METYIVRVWSTDHSAEPTAEASVRGVIRHVRSGRETSFASWEELRGILAAPAALPTSRPAEASPGPGGA